MHSQPSPGTLVPSAWSYGYKLLWADYEGRPAAKLPPPLRAFDMRSDSVEDNNLIPALQRLCGQSDDFSFSFEDIARLDRSTVKQGGDVGNTKSVLKLISYLQLKMHLFRHLGETEFLLFHENKPFETEVSCDARRSSVPTFTWTTHFLAPEFCGDAAYKELGPPFCRCALSNCSQHWYRPIGSGAWATGRVGGGLNGIVPPSGTMLQYLRDVLQWSRFSPICPKVIDEANEKKSVSNKAPSLLTLPKCHRDDDNNENDNGGWAYGDLAARALSGNFTAGRYQCHCHQRLHRRGKHVHLTGATCGADAPVLTINHHGMHAPLPLCPKSFEKVKRSSGAYMDDNVMMIALNDVMFGGNQINGRRSYLSAAALGTLNPLKSYLKAKRVQILNSQIAIIDPLFFHTISRCARTMPVSLPDILGNEATTDEFDSSSAAAVAAATTATSSVGSSSSWSMLKNVFKKSRSSASGDKDALFVSTNSSLSSFSSSSSSSSSLSSACRGYEKVADFKTVIGGLGGFVTHFEKRISGKTPVPLSLVVMPIYDNKIWSLTVLVLRSAGTKKTVAELPFVVHYNPTGEPNPPPSTVHSVVVALWHRMMRSQGSQDAPSSQSSSAGTPGRRRRLLSNVRELSFHVVQSSPRGCSAEESGFHVIRFANVARELLEVRVRVRSSNCSTAPWRHENCSLYFSSPRQQCLICTRLLSSSKLSGCGYGSEQ